MDFLIKLAAQDLIVVPVLATFYIFWRLEKSKRQNFLILLIGGGILSLLLAKIGNHFYWDPRPFIKDGITPLFTAHRDNGFPSDHTLLSAFLGFVTLGYWRKLGAALLVVAVIVGWARVAAGVHHFVDIIGSFIFTGLAWLLVSKLINTRPKKSQSIPSTTK